MYVHFDKRFVYFDFEFGDFCDIWLVTWYFYIHAGFDLYSCVEDSRRWVFYGEYFQNLFMFR
jgi:hypothetical protein